MPIKIPNNLPATSVLEKENIFVMYDDRAYSQDIRPLKILILNLMPTKAVTETQLLRLLGNTPLQVEVDFIYTASYMPQNTSREHLTQFYGTFADVKHKNYENFDEENLSHLLCDDDKGIVVDIKGVLRGKINNYKYWTL